MHLSVITIHLSISEEVGPKVTDDSETTGGETMDLTDLSSIERLVGMVVYIIGLEHNCYYVGKTIDLYSRLKDHLDGKGSAWTKLHRPLTLIEVFVHPDPFDEDKFVKRYMALHGIDNVRGGCYITEKLTGSQYKHISTEIWSALGRCIKCGRDNHLVIKCRARFDINGRKIRNYDVKCNKCNRMGHKGKNCYAKTVLKVSDGTGAIENDVVT